MNKYTLKFFNNNLEEYYKHSQSRKKSKVFFFISCVIMTYISYLLITDIIMQGRFQSIMFYYYMLDLFTAFTYGILIKIYKNQFYIVHLIFSPILYFWQIFILHDGVLKGLDHFIIKEEDGEWDLPNEIMGQASFGIYLGSVYMMYVQGSNFLNLLTNGFTLYLIRFFFCGKNLFQAKLLLMHFLVFFAFMGFKYMEIKNQKELFLIAAQQSQLRKGLENILQNQSQKETLFFSYNYMQGLLEEEDEKNDVSAVQNVIGKEHKGIKKFLSSQIVLDKDGQSVLKKQGTNLVNFIHAHIQKFIQKKQNIKSYQNIHKKINEDSYFDSENFYCQHPLNKQVTTYDEQLKTQNQILISAYDSNINNNKAAKVVLQFNKSGTQNIESQKFQQEYIQKLEYIKLNIFKSFQEKNIHKKDFQLWKKFYYGFFCQQNKQLKQISADLYCPAWYSVNSLTPETIQKFLQIRTLPINFMSKITNQDNNLFFTDQNLYKLSILCMLKYLSKEKLKVQQIEMLADLDDQMRDKDISSPSPLSRITENSQLQNSMKNSTKKNNLQKSNNLNQNNSQRRKTQQQQQQNQQLLLQQQQSILNLSFIVNYNEKILEEINNLNSLNQKQQYKNTKISKNLKIAQLMILKIGPTPLIKTELIKIDDKNMLKIKLQYYTKPFNLSIKKTCLTSSILSPSKQRSSFIGSFKNPQSKSFKFQSCNNSKAFLNNDDAGSVISNQDIISIEDTPIEEGNQIQNLANFDKKIKNKRQSLDYVQIQQLQNSK